METPLQTCAQLLRTSDYYVERSLANLDREQLVARLGAANSILWLLGHVTVGRCRLRNLLGDVQPIAWTEVFGKGSGERPGVELPSLTAVLEQWFSAGRSIAAQLELVDERQLMARAPVTLPGAEDDSVLGMVTYLAFHEAYHVGQIAQMRKALGQPMARRTIEGIALAMQRGEETAR